jgi:DNA repair protein RecO (recombination protein O)
LSANRLPHDAHPAFVLHGRAYRETSLIVEAFTRDHGRIAVVARGARRPRSALRGVLLAFQPLLLSWTGKSELRTLVHAEWQGAYASLHGQALICGFYLNELLLKLLARDDPHERLFTRYTEAVAALQRGGEPAAGVLRRFELHLLREMGYEVALDRDAESGEPVVPHERYRYIVERGPVRAIGGAQNGLELAGRTLLDMHCGTFEEAATLHESKALMRTLITHYLGSQPLHTRQLLLDLQQL